MIATDATGDAGAADPGAYYGYPLCASAALIGSKRAVLSQGRIWVSPAMMTLIKGAQADGRGALEKLLRRIPLLDLDAEGIKPLNMGETE